MTVVDLGTVNADGLTTYVGVNAANALKTGEVNTIQCFSNAKSQLWLPLACTGVTYADYWLKEEIQKSLPNTSLAGGAAVYERILNGFYNQITVVTGEKP